MCPVAEFSTVPNSAGSPPMQKVDPFPVMRIDRLSPSVARPLRASTKESLIEAEKAFLSFGRFNWSSTCSDSALTRTVGLVSSGLTLRPLPSNHFLNSFPFCKVPYETDSSSNPRSVERFSVCLKT
ncbi:MAG: Uncharacterised protein [Acidimicrobiaceae bacterium]|nr:MAG: Uncharacterised protein [Acidimicrobiaceae bacterium]